MEPPSGGPEDKEPPRVVATYPDSGATGVPLTDSLALQFNEPMLRRTVEGSFFLSPPVTVRERFWKQDTWVLRLAEPLHPEKTYAGLLGTAIKDRHGLSPPKPWSFAFATGDSLDTGEVEGKVFGSRYSPKNVMIYVWPWADGPPDTTVQGYPPEPLRLGQADAQGAYTLQYLPRGKELRLCALYDQQNDQQYDPGRDYWGCAEEPVSIGDTTRVVRGVQLYLAEPDEPGTVAGTAADSSCLRSSAAAYLGRERARRDSLRGWLDRRSPEAVARERLKLGLGVGESPEALERSDLVPDSLRVTAEDSLRIGRQMISIDSLLSLAAAESARCAQPIVVRLFDADSGLVREAKGKGDFRWSDIPPGTYGLSAFRDLNADGKPDPEEPKARMPEALQVRPLRVLDKLLLQLRWPPGLFLPPLLEKRTPLLPAGFGTEGVDLGGVPASTRGDSSRVARPPAPKHPAGKSP